VSLDADDVAQLCANRLIRSVNGTTNDSTTVNEAPSTPSETLRTVDNGESIILGEDASTASVSFTINAERRTVDTSLEPAHASPSSPNDRWAAKYVRRSSTNRSGTSIAAKWPPSGMSTQWSMS